MSALEWMDLEVLDADLAAARTRLADVNAFRQVGRVQAIEQEIADLEVRRDRLLARLTARISEIPDAAEQSLMIDANEPRTYEEQFLAEPGNDIAELMADIDDKSDFEIRNPIIGAVCEEDSAETGEPRSLCLDPTRPDAPPQIDSLEGLSSVWDVITPTHIEQATSELDARRAEILARHEDELKTLDAEQGEIEFLEHSIEVFTQKYGNGLASSIQQQP